jgi:hypothetical protein
VSSLTDPASAPRRARRWLLEQLQRIDPARLVPLGARDELGTVAVLCIYRRRNAHFVPGIVAGVPHATLRLWALDEADPTLAGSTIGVGPGGRTELLNRLWRALDEEPETLVIADDDIEWIIGDLGRLVAAERHLGLDMVQPSHTRRSRAAFGFVRKHRLMAARETTFVEQGPLLALSRRAQRAVLPLPEELVMGWGISARWWRTAKEANLHLGIIDAVAVCHDAGAPARREYTYDTSGEHERLRKELAAIGLDDTTQLQRTVRRYTLGGRWTTATEDIAVAD